MSKTCEITVKTTEADGRPGDTSGPFTVLEGDEASAVDAIKQVTMAVCSDAGLSAGHISDLVSDIIVSGQRLPPA